MQHALAEKVLATMRAIKESGPDRWESPAFLKVIAEAFADHRRMLEMMRYISGPEFRAEYDEQIARFLLLEDECRSQGSGERPV